MFFIVHGGLIVHHTYYDASLRNTRSFPHASSPDEPKRWHNWLDLNRWDSGCYETITREGYRDPWNPGRPRYVIQWFPGYPLVARFFLALFGCKVTLIFSLLSVLFTLAFWLLLWSPVMIGVLGKKVTEISSVIILCWPGAYYWFAGMTEPLVGLIMLLIIYLWFSQRFNWIVAVLC